MARIHLAPWDKGYETNKKCKIIHPAFKVYHFEHIRAFFSPPLIYIFWAETEVDSVQDGGPVKKQKNDACHCPKP